MILYSRRGLHGQLVESLGKRIVRGELLPGDVVDVDRLEVDHAVSRTVVREAIKVLTTKGLLDARPKRGTFVRPRAQWNLLDADVMTWRDEGHGPDQQLLQDLDEVRRAVEPPGARLAAERRTEQDLAEIDAALQDMVDTAHVKGDEHIAADLRFHRAVLVASHNELLARLEVVLEPALRARNALAFSEDSGNHFIEAHRRVLEQIRSGDGPGAQKAMEMLLVDAAADTAAILARRAPGRRRAGADRSRKR